jgi:hypothetical protein
MAQYDPQRSRSRHRSGEDEGPAPVDALLGPTGAADPAEPPDLIDLTDTGAASRSVGDAAGRNGSGSPAWSDAAGGQSTGAAPVRPVLIAVAAVAAIALVWAWLRRRRTRPAAD